MRTDAENTQAHDEISYGPPPADKLSTKETIQLSLTFCIIWFLANWSTNASLAYTTVGSSTILSSMSGMSLRESGFVNIVGNCVLMP
jgi:solute carrier family 35 protein F5